MAESKTLGEAYAGYGVARRDWMEDVRGKETFGNALEAGADLSFFAAGELEAKGQSQREFETTQKMLGDEAEAVNLKTGEKWQDRTLFGFGDKESYLNPFSGGKGLRVGDTLYDEIDIAGISRGSEYLALKKDDTQGLANYRDNLSSVYGRNIGETKWGKTELDTRHTVAEEQVSFLKEQSKGGYTGKDIQPRWRTKQGMAKGQEDFKFGEETSTSSTSQARDKERNIVQNRRETTVRQHNNLIKKDEQGNLLYPEIEIGLSPNQRIAKQKADQAKIEAGGKKAYDEAYAQAKKDKEAAKEAYKLTPKSLREQEIERIRREEVLPFEEKRAGDEAEARVRKDWEPLLERQKNLMKMKGKKARKEERASIWEEFLVKSMNNE